MRTRPYGSWTRENRRTRYYSSRRSKKWRPNRGLLVLVGLALVLASVGVVFADVRKAGEYAATPQSTTMKLTVPSMKRVKDVPVYNAPATNEAALHDGTLHVEGTGYPWQREANVYIAGHRLGYPRTRSFLVFWDLNELRRGDRVVLTDSEGRRYVYKVFDRFVVGPNDGSVKAVIPGKNIVSLQTCTLPDYAERLIVRAELARTLPAPQRQASAAP